MKHVFFDIDGTLWDRRSVIPKSTIEAINRLNANGHKAYINTGRTRGYITSPDLLALPFSGIIAGCGTHIEVDGKMLFEYLIPGELATKAIDTTRRFGFRSILEGPEYLYMEYDEFKDDPYGQKVMRDLGDTRMSIMDNYGRWRINKFSSDMTGCDKETCFGFLKEDFDFILHNDVIVEIVPKGFNKGRGIFKLCEIKEIDIADTIAIGDSINDLDMFEVAGTSVAMGNGSSKTKEAADFVTTSMDDDGIYNALSHLGLI